MSTTRVIGIAVALVAVGMVGLGVGEEVGLEPTFVDNAAACQQPGKCGGCKVNGGSIDGGYIVPPSIECHN